MGIYVWGTGCGASELIGQGLSLSRITAFVDSFPSGDTFLGKPVLTPQELELADCQLLIVTTRHTEAVAQRCSQLGIPEDRLLFLKNHCRLHDRNGACSAARDILGEVLLRRLLPVQRIVSTPPSLTGSLLPEADLKNDYVRLATLELLCRQVAHLPGAAAELGVYRGFFARCINQLMPERRLYLFDSFESFAPEACAPEAFQAAHANTTAAQVLQLMPHPASVLIRPGFFPGTAAGLEEERFCLVSLDVDFAQTTLDGLRFFWPRMIPGGYILLHDYNSSLSGVAQALAQFRQETSEIIPCVPLCDIGGTLILCK